MGVDLVDGAGTGRSAYLRASLVWAGWQVFRVLGGREISSADEACDLPDAGRGRSEAPPAFAGDRSLAALTFSRFIAALSVLLYHFGENVWPIDATPVNDLIRVGQPAVTFFFVLSGYVMARFHPFSPPARGFWLARLARVYPVYLLGLLATALFVRGDWTSFITQLLLVQAWVPTHAIAWNWVGWSLSVETSFYVVFPALIAIARRMPPAWWAAATLAVWTSELFWTSDLESFITRGGTSWSQEFVDYFPPHHAASFLAGMTIGLPSRRAALARDVAWPATLIGSAATAGLLFLNGAPTARIVPLAAFVPGFTLVVFGLSGLDLGRLWRPLAFLGAASYALYILQVPIALGLVRLLPEGHDPAMKLFFFLPAAITLSCLVFAFYETPLRRMIRRWS